MNGQVSDPMEQGRMKSLAQPSKARKSLGSLGKELGQDTWGFPGAWDPWDMQQSQLGIETFQGGIPRNIKNKNGYAPINHIMMKKRGSKSLGTNNS